MKVGISRLENVNLTFSEKFFLNWQNLPPNFRGLVLAAEIIFFQSVFSVGKVISQIAQNTYFLVFWDF